MDIFSDDFFKPKEFNLHKFIIDIGNLDDITSMALLDKISVLNRKDREKVFNNALIKYKLKLGLLSESRSNQWYYYRQILSKISASEFLSLYDADFLNKYFTLHQGEYLYRFWASLCEKDINTILNLIIDDDKILDNFLKEINNFESLFENIDYNLLVKLLYKLQDRDGLFDYEFLVCICKEHQYLLLNDDKINDNTLVHLINNFSYEVKSYFFKNDRRALYLFDKFDIPLFIKTNIIFNDDILKRKEFFELLKDKSLVTFRNNINNVERYNNPMVIEERVEEYYNNILSLYSSDFDMFTPYKEILDNPSKFVNSDKNVSYLFHFDIIDKFTSLLRMDDNNKYYFENKEELVEFLKSETSKKISEIIIDSLFKDNIYNVWINIKEMLRYNDNLSISDKILDTDKLQFYDLIIKFDKISNVDKIKFYNYFRDKNINLMFYQDLRMVKDYAYDKIKEDLFNISTCSLSCVNKDGVNIYDARDINYNMLVRTQAKYREYSHYPRNCYSIISNENTSVFGECDSNSFLYGYNSFNNDMVLHMFERDSFSSGFREKSSRYVNRIMTTDELVKSSNTYSEIQLINKSIDNKKHKYNVEKPNFIVVFDNVRNADIEEAKRLNIPIVIIKKQKLENEININFDEDLDSYVEMVYTENAHRMNR